MAHHGNTPAAWACVLIMLAGFVVGGIGLVLQFWPVFWAGVAMQPAGLLVGGVMAKAGYGNHPVPQPREEA